MDPLTVFSAAGNALQFAELGIKIVSKTIEYSSGGGSQEHQALQDVVQRLMVSNAHLHQLMEDTSDEEKLPHGPARALHYANQECLRVAQEFFNLLGELKLNRYRTFWRSVKLALINIKKKKDIELMTQRIQDARANLMLSFMVYIEHQTNRNHAELRADNSEIFQGLHKVAEEASTMKDMKESLASLATRLEEIEIDDHMAKEQFKDTLGQNWEALKIVSQRLSTHFEEENLDLAAASSQIEQLVPLMERELAARRRIIESLYSRKMNDRRNHIARAHGQTYQWIFRPKENSNKAVWDDFLKWLCKQDNEPIYWIFGKPGCGKTTLMRELDERMREQVEYHTWYNQKDCLQAALQEWVGKGDLLEGSCYFWYAGTAEQKSLSGLLQSLSYQLLQQLPDLINKVVAGSRWDDAICSLHMRPWEEIELLGILDGIIEHTEAEDKILLFIDGLDEYDGPDHQREKFLGLLRRLTRSPHSKACVASRPWNIFRDAFEQCPQLCLETLTKVDISDYVHEKLGEDPLFQRQQRRVPRLLEVISDAITSKARGVFLWVHLVVRDLLKVLRDGGRSNDLFEELKRIPPDLDDYFIRMLESIEGQYRQDAGMILQAALCNMDYVRDNNEDMASGPDLYLIHLDYLNQNMDPCFAAKPDLPDILDEQDAESRDEILESLHRRLASRCMGLLESEMSSSWAMFLRPSADLWLTRIEFLHRTVKDFLLKPLAQRILHDYTNGSFDAYLFRCNLLIVNVVTSILRDDIEGKYASILCFFRQIQTRREPEEASFILFDRMVHVLKQQVPDLTLFLTSGRLDGTAFTTLTEFILQWKGEPDPALSLAKKLGWEPYVESRLKRENMQPRQNERRRGRKRSRRCFTDDYCPEENVLIGDKNGEKARRIRKKGNSMQ